MEKVIVTGGAGFVGSHLSEELLAKGYHVTILDNLSTGKIDNIAALLKKKVDFIQGSITELALLLKIFQNVQYVFHLAAIPSVPRSIDCPELSHEVNITGTLNVLLAARDRNVKKVVYASSSSVYGDSHTLPNREDMLPNPQSPYAATNLAGEYYCNVFHRVYSVQTICLRYFNVYGPRQDPDSQYASVIPRFINEVLQERRPTIFGDGEQTRDFIFVKDVVKANILAAENSATGIFNIGGGEAASINQLATMIIGLLGSNVEPIYGKSISGDVRHSVADTSRARALGWLSKYSLKEGLGETIRNFKCEI